MKKPTKKQLREQALRREALVIAKIVMGGCKTMSTWFGKQSAIGIAKLIYNHMIDGYTFTPNIIVECGATDPQLTPDEAAYIEGKE